MSDAIKEFADSIIGDWGEAMDTFFNKVAARQKEANLSDAEVNAALVWGYGHEVAADWDEWIDETL